MCATELCCVPRNTFSAWHDPNYDVIGQMLGGHGLEIFRGDVKKDGRKAGAFQDKSTKNFKN